MRVSDWSSYVCSSYLGATAALEEERVAGDQAVVDQEALAARGVAGRVDELDGDLAHHHGVTRDVGDQVGVAGAGDPLDPGLLGLLDVDRHRGDGERSEEHTSELQSLMRISYAV